MHPAYSVILFTTSAGAGYGLLFWLSLAEAFGALPGGRWLALVAMTVALGLVTLGLLSSMLHLGHPERALGSFTQWRSSWLSREGVAAVATYAPAGLLWLIWLLDIKTGWTAPLSLLAAAGAVVTVYCTGMIYASLRTIRHWYRPDVPLIYLTLSASTGALLFCLLLSLFGHAPPWTSLVLAASLAVSGALKLRYWANVDANPGQYTAEMATGLGHLGTVRPLDSPHTMPNFVMREMGYSVARKHARKLRRFSLLFLIVIPLAAAALALAGAAWVEVLFLAAALSAAWGVLTERWLFFAEAEHLSQLYYGASRA